MRYYFTFSFQYLCIQKKNFIVSELNFFLGVSYIHDHYGNELDVGRIASAASIGESECLRCFRNTRIRE